ncbi:MAG: cell division protein FtsQ/DivIB [Oscillochloridaceae bacterium umkhey_bin13]
MHYNEPNTRERIAARRQRRRPNSPAPGLQATPGMRAAALGWLTSGRIVSLVILLVACAALGYLFIDPRFSVQQIQVEGQTALDADAVAAMAQLQGRPIWFVDHVATVARLKENAYIAAASVEVRLPDQALIRIVERRPEVRWQAGGVQYLVDATGKVLGVATEPAETDVLVITDNWHSQLNPKDQLDRDAILLAQALYLRLPVELGFTPTLIGWDYALGVYALTATDQMIVFGQSEALDRKLAVLNVIFRDQTPFRYLDLRPSNPFYQE